MTAGSRGVPRVAFLRVRDCKVRHQALCAVLIRETEVTSTRESHSCRLSDPGSVAQLASPPADGIYFHEGCIYAWGGVMTKRLIDIDDALLAAAQEAAGQDSIKGTVTEALDRLVAQQRRREEHLRASWADLGEVLADLQDDEVMREAWA